ncbi:hypothetical protein MQX03_11615 [Chryseobacterium aahli]|uniref:hypothetical protein n=1 Tax=Chryseobacterium aahli TaxID=1278643 RepID=UPI001F600FA0|nr:hypothetical protein [Chryseobacterium aahli]MCI3937851.1 hypothetical protein [Chryseobacterium aahli]
MQNKIKLRILLLIIIFLPNMVMSQDKRINMIVIIDNEICISVEEFKINTLKPIIAKYSVGNLNLSYSEYDQILNNKEENVNIDITNSILSKNKSYFIKANYKLNLPKVYLKQEYIIINIYSLSKKENRRKFSKIAKDKEYYVTIKSTFSMKFE